ncbi:hypothetical protein AGMMS50212_05520 [Spirochaetia bacterium]|nr:hypothetical protein AGMMS50212_05520 [Spirochaetia bacterium]
MKRQFLDELAYDLFGVKYRYLSEDEKFAIQDAAEYYRQERYHDGDDMSVYGTIKIGDERNGFVINSFNSDYDSFYGSGR